MNILVTGAGGYVGSVITELLVAEGYQVIALDNLKQGHREAIAPEITCVLLDLADSESLGDIFHRYRLDAVMHLAAETVVEDSVVDPRSYFRNNVFCGVNLLDAMVKHGVQQLIFSSSAAVYGQPDKVPINESDAKLPLNPYGESKLMFERILHWYGCAYGLSFVSLRYFNAAGASQRFGEDHRPETHLVPNVLKVALEQRGCVSVFGTDYPTKDGSCVRDYVHVLDIAQAHILALEHLGQGQTNKAYNLGNGEGYSVLEVIEAARRVTGVPIRVEVCPRRPGDPAVLVANSKLAQVELGWQPQYPEIASIIESAWRWMKEHPYGYGK